jgi:outer membrane lipoprotein-sorting protein
MRNRTGGAPVTEQARDRGLRGLTAGLCASLLGLLWASSAIATPTAEQIWAKVASVQANVQDYTCHVRVTPQIPDQDNTPREATVYVKRPDKVRIDADSVVFIPREALIPGEIAKHVGENTRLVLMGQTTETGRTLYGLKAIPTGDRAKNVRFKFWVWGDNWTIKRTELWVDDARVMVAEWWFIQAQDTYWVPYWIVATFSADKLAQGIPAGSVTVQFWDYSVNTGLQDSIFPDRTQIHRRFHRE